MMDLAKLFEALGTLVRPEQCKVHFARPDGPSDPLKLSKGEFEEWQSFQTKRNFTRDFVVALIRKGKGSDRWHFAGVYKVEKPPKPADESHRSRARELGASEPKWVYSWMCRLPVPDELEDTTVCFQETRVGRTGYRFANNKLLKEGTPRRSAARCSR